MQTEAPARSWFHWPRGRRRSQVRIKLPLGALLMLTLILSAVVFGPIINAVNPYEQDLSNALAPASRQNWLGTDELGRDVLSRLLLAGRVSIGGALQAVVIALLLGVLPGLVAGYVGGWVDTIANRVAEVLMSFPPLILAIAIVAALGPGLTNAMTAIGVMLAPRFFRLVRASVMEVRSQTYIEASLTIGSPTSLILRKHVLRNVSSPVLVQIPLVTGTAMLAEAGLSFLGLGVQPPSASWGSLVSGSVRYSFNSPWLPVYPGLAIAATVLCMNLVGDGIRDRVAATRRSNERE